MENKLTRLIKRLQFQHEGMNWYYKDYCITHHGKNNLGCFIHFYKDEIDIFAVYSVNTDDKEPIFAGKIESEWMLINILKCVGFDFDDVYRSIYDEINGKISIYSQGGLTI